MKKPKRLKVGDRVAAVSLFWGGPGQFPHRYEAGKRQFENEFGLQVIAMPNALKSPEWIEKNPKARAEDLMMAFEDPSIKAIISTIGGEDSIRILPHLDLSVIESNPKVFVGYSDTTVTHLVCFKAGLVSFYGPALMSGFAENCGMSPYLRESFKKTTFQAEPIGLLQPNDNGWTVEHLDWGDPSNQSRHRSLQPCDGWKFLQGEGVARGRLLGGCLEVLEWMRGTPVWPCLQEWEGAILFLETSEEAPAPSAVIRTLRAYASEGVLGRLAGILMGRPGGQIDPAKFEEYDKAVLKVVSEEEGLLKLPVVSRMDFGHTDPFLTLPYGVEAEVDCVNTEIRIIESAVEF